MFDNSSETCELAAACNQNLLLNKISKQCFLIHLHLTSGVDRLSRLQTRLPHADTYVY